MAGLWVSIDNGKPGQWVGYWLRSEVEAVVALAGVDEKPGWPTVSQASRQCFD